MLHDHRFEPQFALRRLLLCSATYFVSNAGSNTAPYDTEAKAANALATIAALPWTNADTVKCKGGDAQTAGAAITYTFPTSVGLRILSVDFNGSGTGGLSASKYTINVGAANSAFTVGTGYVYGYGIAFVGGTNNNAACDLIVGVASTGCGHRWDFGTFSAPSINTSALIIIGGATGGSNNDDMTFEFNDCTFSNGVNKSILINNRIRMTNPILAGSTPTSLFAYSSNTGCTADIEIDGGDLSNILWTNLFSIGGGSTGRAVVRQSTMPSGFVVVTGTFSGPGSPVFELFDCHSGDEHFHYKKRCFQGSIDSVNTHYADASDGTNSFSLAMASSANASFTWPLIAPDLGYFNSTLSAMAPPVAVAHNAVGGGTGGKLLNSEMWVEEAAKATSGSTKATWNIADRVADILTAGADQDTDGTTSWTGSSIATHDSLVPGSFTPAEVGFIRARVKLAKPSVTVYVNPKILSGSAKQWLTPEGVYVNEAPSTARSIQVNNPSLIAA